MTLLLHSEGDPPAPDVVVFGSGALGGAVSRRLQRLHPFTSRPLAMPWDVPSARAAALDDLHAALQWRSRQRPVEVVWAAGKAGFSAGEDDAADDLAAFTDVVDVVKRLNDGGGRRHTLHMMSSAGGLFEGRVVRSSSQAPTPLRPYGHVKLAQERHAVDVLSPDRVAIYRPSSVYAVPGHGRPGLIGALVRNGLAQRTTTIVGALGTLRDYVLASDVGNYVAQRVLAHDGGGTTDMLVAGHPASILQVIRAVESVLRRRLYVRIAEAWNAENITFSPSVRAPRFATAPLRVGVELVYGASLGAPTVP